MFKVNDVPILASELEVLEKLKADCNALGKEYFKVFRPTGRNIMTTCPFHKQGQERKPSFGISTVDGMCHCFTCGYVSTLSEMVSNVFGKVDGGYFGAEWLAKNFLVLSVETRKPLSLNLERGVKQPTESKPGFTEEELDKYRYIHPYMYERGLTDELIEEFDVGFDMGTNCLTFPVYYHNNSPAFIARRSVSSKFFNYPRDVEKPVYMAQRIVSGQYSEVVITEGIFDCISSWKYGRPAVSLLGLGSDYQYKVLNSLPVRKYILALDADQAGYNAMARLRKQLSRTKLLSYLAIPQGEDVNSLGEELKNIVEVF